jgi:hypothetical protein
MPCLLKKSTNWISFFRSRWAMCTTQFTGLMQRQVKTASQTQVKPAFAHGHPALSSSTRATTTNR